MFTRRCPSCGAQNRIPAERLSDAGRCGACKARLAPTDEPIDVDQARLEEIIAKAKVPILIDFWAPWCGPCRMAGPEVRRAAAQTAGRAVVLKVNTDEAPALASRFGVQGIPFFVVIQGGRVVHKHAGLTRAAELVAWLDRAAASASARRRSDQAGS